MDIIIKKKREREREEECFTGQRAALLHFPVYIDDQVTSLV